ncbi:MAG: hypothetical protein A3H37_02235 [Candidatus Schekmanbacteria bacterium RIFCSPLOWO2_02_FULL_38_14]|uniref:Uncharacterized protein n=1 Tax=Candidatus Schekmanbacteria bacterium RIFCSPLOWO2_12_FULL_38_15 TaxID=1817883 RepID=A0A1F7SCM2_9BACT|nr:MAG: hypothetical protein A3H37_02235 [Candidatus Schekmanbacteria bacterium RIFCSPLOWO2_02_FULL_38_14]OGL51515.1 MAG: hypothetical protein A3G31_03410 [Candidatus Schekmanbacteria bacterium RIFCSPLOWO2_12_FULL_38_15]
MLRSKNGILLAETDRQTDLKSLKYIISKNPRMFLRDGTARVFCFFAGTGLAPVQSDVAAEPCSAYKHGQPQGLSLRKIELRI